MNFYQDIITELMAYFSQACSKKQIKMLEKYLLQEAEGRSVLIENFQKERNIKAQYIEMYSNREIENRAQDLLYLYFNLCRRNIAVGQYEVHYSNIIKKLFSSEEFPEDLKKVIKQIRSDLQSGNNVNGRLSKKAKEILKYEKIKSESNEMGETPKKKMILKPQEDGLLYSWGMYHLHLDKNLEKENSFYYHRTGELLIVYIPFKEKQAYFLNVIMEHGKPGQAAAFAKQEYLNILEKNWPHLLDRYRISPNDSRNNFEPFSDENIRYLRKNGVNTVTANIFGPGGGINADKSSTCVQIRVHKFLKEVDRIRKKIENNENQSCASRTEYKLVLRDDQWIVMNGNQMIGLLVNDWGNL